MLRTHHRWHSPSLGRNMDLLQFGHGGARMVVFPSSMGKFFEWEDQGMIGALAPQIEAGQLQLWCVDSVDSDSWYAKWKIPTDRARAQAAYDAYVRHEVLPLSEHANGNPFLIMAGASFGAYHAMSIGLHHPDKVSRIIGLSGLYDIREQTGGYSDEQVYFQNPADYIQGEHDAERLARLRLMDIIIAIGRDDPMRPGNEEFSRRLHAKGLWHALRIWDGWAHDWPYWRQMIVTYVGGHD
jgi:esterase/lipase superfamily enzyme